MPPRPRPSPINERMRLSPPPAYRPGPTGATQRALQPRTVPGAFAKIPAVETQLPAAAMVPIARRSAPPVYQPVRASSPLLPRPASLIAAPTVQRMISTKTEKRIKNVLTLGVRKLYVYAKRRARAQQGGGVAIVPVGADIAVEQDVSESSSVDRSKLERHRRAYDKAVFYHNTNPTNAPSIHQHGLLNYRDRVQNLGGDVVGMSLRGGAEYQGDEQKGVFLGKREFAKEQGLPGSNVRAVLPPERTNKPIGWWGGQPQPTGPDDERLFLDEKFRGGGLYTPASIPPEQVWSGKFTETGAQRVKTICETIAQQYDEPKPSWEEVLTTHLAAIEEGYVSDEALEDRFH